MIAGSLRKPDNRNKVREFVYPFYKRRQLNVTFLKVITSVQGVRTLISVINYIYPTVRINKMNAPVIIHITLSHRIKYK